MLQELQSPLIESTPAAVRGVAASRDGQYVATADVDRIVRMIKSGSLLWEKDFRSTNDRYRAMDLIRALAFDDSGNMVFVGAGDAVLGLDADTGREVWRNEALPTYGFLITTPLSIAFNRSSEFSVAYADGSLDVYTQAEDGIKLRNRWMENEGPIAIAYLRNGEQIVGTDHFALSIWDTSSGIKLVRSVPGEKMHSVAASKVDNVVAARTLSEIWFWNSETGDLIGRTQTLPGLPTLAFSPTAPVLAGTDAMGVVFHNYDGSLIERREVPEGVPLCLSFAPDGRSLHIGLSTGDVIRLEVGF